MGSKLSTKAQLQLGVLEEARRKVDRIYALVEQMAGARVGQEGLMPPIGRAATELARLLMNNGLGVMADTSNQIAMLAKRGGSVQTKTRGFREMVNSIKAAIDTRAKVIVAEDGREQGEGAG